RIQCQNWLAYQPDLLSFRRTLTGWPRMRPKVERILELLHLSSLQAGPIYEVVVADPPSRCQNRSRPHGNGRLPISPVRPLPCALTIAEQVTYGNLFLWHVAFGPGLPRVTPGPGGERAFGMADY